MEESSIEIVLLLEKTLKKVVSFERNWECMLTLGISTARSTPNLNPSFSFTLTLFAQLPASVISLGLSNATFQFVSSVGRGSEYGTATPFFKSFRAASRGCWGETEGIPIKNV